MVVAMTFTGAGDWCSLSLGGVEGVATPDYFTVRMKVFAENAIPDLIHNMSNNKG
jgi:hypothetical protein